MTSNAMKPFFEMSSEIHDALHRLVQEHYKRDATGEEYFQFPLVKGIAKGEAADAKNIASPCFTWTYKAVFDGGFTVIIIIIISLID